MEPEEQRNEEAVIGEFRVLSHAEFARLTGSERVRYLVRALIAMRYLTVQVRNNLTEDEAEH